MPKYEAVIDLTVEVDALDSDSADSMILGGLTNEILNLAKDKYKIWIDVRQIDEVVENA